MGRLTGTVTDIFISYSKESKAQTEQLTKESQAKGFTVWYDTSLVPGDSFRDAVASSTWRVAIGLRPARPSGMFSSGK
jgi:hypothetical protein